MTDQEKIEQFRSDCGSMKRWTERLIEIHDELLELDHQLHGLPSHELNGSVTKYPTTSNYKLYDLWSDEEALLAERETITNSMNLTRRRLDRIADPKIRQMIIDLWMDDRYTSDQVADRYHTSKANMYKTINKLIPKIF